MRCLLRLISSRIPVEDLSSCEIGQELYLATQYFQMRSVDETKMYESITAFADNLRASVFNKLKSNYHRMCRFKASIAIRMASECLFAWRSWVAKKVSDKNNVKKMRNVIGVRKFQTIMQ
jgi:hypothetical protein